MNFCNRLILLFAVWLIFDAKVEAYKSGCSGRYCFVISDYTNDSERLVQPDAQEWCRSNGTQLAEITSEDIQNSIVNFIRSVYSQGLGGWDVLINGKRSPVGNWTRLSGNNVDNLIFNEETDPAFGYAYLKPNGSGFDLFASKPADNKEGFICTGPSLCSEGGTLSGQCYQRFTETLSWYDARNRCLDRGGDLASFDYITTNDGFKPLKGYWLDPSINYWIGIRRESWTWQGSNSDIKYSDFATGHPYNHVARASRACLCLASAEWNWFECHCAQELPFICMFSDNNVSSTSSTTTPTSTHTSPTSTSTTTTTQTTPTSTSTTTTTNTTPTSTSTTTTARSTTSTARSSTSASTSVDSSKTTSNATSESNEIPTPTFPDSNSSTATNAAGDMEKTLRLTVVGLGVGITLTIVFLFLN